VSWGFLQTPLSHRLIVSGSRVELIQAYRHSVRTLSSEEQDAQNRQNRIRSFRRKVAANAYRWINPKNNKPYVPLFITLTFESNVIDIPYANKQFNLFVKRFNRSVLHSKKAILKYATVIEFQQRGAIHFHTIFFNPLDISKFYDLVHYSWTHGHCHLKKVHNQTHLINYVHKDLTKLRQKKELHGHKSYFCSKVLYQPLLHRDKQKIKAILPPTDKQQYTKTFYKDSLTTTYTLYKI